MANLYQVKIIHTCGHVAYSFSTQKDPAERKVDHQCDICSGRLRRMLRAYTDKPRGGRRA